MPFPTGFPFRRATALALGGLVLAGSVSAQTAIRGVTLSTAGLAMIDFETWQPTWSWSGCDGTPAAVPVCAASLQRVKRANPTWNASAVAIEAERQWGEAAMSFMTRTIEAGRSARPNAKWSFYDYPSCGDAAGEYGGADTSCPSGMQEGNEKLAWMYNITVSACSGNACILPRYSIIVRSCRFAVRAC